MTALRPTSALARRLLLVGLLLLVPAGLQAQTPPAPGPETPVDGRPAIGQAVEMAEQIEFYYRSPDPNRAIETLATLDMARFLDAETDNERSHGLAVLGAFFAHILRTDPTLTEPLVEAAIASGDPEKAVVAAIAVASSGRAETLWAFGRLGQSGLLPAQTIEDARAMAPYPFPTMVAESHFDLDLFWVSFYATGETRYVAKVIDALGYWTPENVAAYSSPHPEQFGPSEQRARRRALIQVFTAVTAQESLRYNALRHPEILSFLRSEASGREGDIGAVLGAVVADADARGAE